MTHLAHSRIEPLEPRTLFAEVTFITHGLEFTSGQPHWLTTMGQAVASAAGPGSALYEADYKGSKVSLTHLSGPTPSSPNFNGEIVLTFNWAAVSDIAEHPGTNTKSIAAAALPLFLKTYPGLGITSPLADLPIHLIGHSRGGSLVAGLAKDLASSGIWVDQQTTLDPHPVHPLFFSSDADVNVYDNVLFADNYYETKDTSLIHGQSVAGAHNIRLNDALPGPSPQRHIGTHAYYYGTIDTAATTDGDGFTIAPSFYTHPSTGPRSAVGFAWSRIDHSPRPADGLLVNHAPRVRTSLSVTGRQVWDNVSFPSPAPSTLATGATLSLPVRFRDDNHDATITLGLDTDANPNNGATTLTSTRTSAIHTSTGMYRAFAPTTSAAAGTYYIFARITNGAHTRYEYSTTPITLT